MANAPTAAQQGVVTAFVTAAGASWWHWFPTAWLISDPQDRDAGVWAKSLRNAVPDLVFLLIDLDDPERPPIGFMRPEWYEWIRQHWQ